LQKKVTHESNIYKGAQMPHMQRLTWTGIAMHAGRRCSLDMFGAIRLRAIAGMFALVISSLLIGWLVGKPGSSNRNTMGFSTSVRNVAVSLVIATDSFPGRPAVNAALVSGLFQSLALAIVAFAWGRFQAINEPFTNALTVSSFGTDQIFEKTKP
jgi:predicted Na+-dependent transporter